MKTNFTKSQVSKNIFTAIVFSFVISFAFAGVIITTSGNNNEINADKAANAVLPAFTQIADIMITEKKANDFANSFGKSKTLVLTAPSGWTFKPNCGAIMATNAKDLAAVSINVSWTTITINFTVNAITNMDAITITGIQVQATDGAHLGCDFNIYRSANNPGTASVNGIITTSDIYGSGGTSFAGLTQTSGVATKLVFAAKPVCSAAGTIFEQQPVVVSQDQFGNPTTNGLGVTQNVTVKLSSGTGALIGTTTMNIGTSGGNGVAVFTDLQVNACGDKKLIATSGSLSFAITNQFSVKEEESSTKISTSDDEDYNPDWMAGSNIKAIPVI